MQRPIVASLWIGGPLSYIEQLCLKSFLDHGHRVVLYAYEEVAGVPDGVEVLDAATIMQGDQILIHKDSGSPAMHSYAFRYRLLEVQNVLWVDLDMLCLKPFDFADQWVFGWGVQDRVVGAGVLGLPRFSKSLAKLNSHCAPAHEGDVATQNQVAADRLGYWGSDAITHFLQKTGEIQYVQSQKAFYPITFKARRDLITAGVDLEEHLDDSVGVHLWSRRLKRLIQARGSQDVPEESFLGQKLLEHGIDPFAAPLEGGTGQPWVLRENKPAAPPVPTKSPEPEALRLPAERMQRAEIDPNLPVMATLWIGGALSFLEQVCLSSFRDQGHKVILYTYGTVERVPDGIEVRDANAIFPNENFIRHARTGSPAIHADAFRYKMLEVENVVWVDADMLCMRPWNFNSDHIFGWEIQGDQTCNAVLKLPKTSETLKLLNDLCRDEYPIPPWADQAEKTRLEAAKAAGSPVHVSELKWGVWGPAALTYFLKQTGEITQAQDETAFFPIPYGSRRELLKPGGMIDARLSDQTFGVHFWNRRLRRKILIDDGGVVAPESFVGRALIRHGIDPAAAPIEDDNRAAERKPEQAAAAPPAPVSVAKKGRRPMPADSAEPMTRRPIDPNLPTVAALWIGGTLSFLEQVCLASFRDFGHRTILYTYGEVHRVPDGIEVLDANDVFPMENYIKHKNSGSPALHSDLFRYFMIQHNDVVWIDADVLCVRPWDFDTPFIYGWEKPPNLICGAVLGFPRNSKTLDALLEFCKDEYPIPPWAGDEERAELHAARDRGEPVHVTELKWGVWGPAALTHFLKETGEVEHTQKREAFYPVSFKDRRDLLEPGRDLTDRIGRGCYAVHLWNRRIRRRIVTDEVGLPDPDSWLGRAVLRHRVDPALAPIPDQPPPGHPARREVFAGLPPFKLSKMRKEYDRRAEIYGAIEDKANESVAGVVPPPEWLDLTEPKEALKEAETSTITAAVDEELDSPLETPETSTNPNVIVQPPAALTELPVMRLTQSPEYQQAIDNLEGRTGDITGYLKDPDQPIRNDKILIVTSMKNEAPFILEWIAYHKSIGVDHFLVYTNDCSDNTNDILDRLDALGHVTRLDNPWDKASGKKPQHVALKDAITQPVYAAADWVLTIDVDEFVNIHVGNGTFEDLFRASNYPNVMSFTWKFFGNKDIHQYVDRPITEQFVDCAPEFIPKPRLGWGFKSMFHKSSPYTRIGVHRPLGIDDGEEDEVRWVNGSGRAMPDMLLTNNGWRSTKRSVGYRLATLNHYILRSTESFLVKRERGRINHTEHDQGIDYWTRRNYATERDDRIHARLPRMHAVLEELKGDPTLAQLHEDAVDWHKGRIASLLQNPDYKKLFEDLRQPDRPDALALAKQAEEEKAAEETVIVQRADKPAVRLKMAEKLTTLRMMVPPASSSTELLHERFRDARTFAERMRGFMWEGPENAVMFVPRSKRLVVAFDNVSIARAEGQRWPWGFKVLAEEMGCSVLGVMAVQRNWFRQEFVHDAMEALRDQGFFDQFDEVLFYGTSMGGFAALTYSRVCPRARVMAIAPQSTLDRNILPNEDRWGWTRKLDWDGRFADAAGATASASDVFIIADPYFQPDHDQVERVTGDNVTWLHTPFMGHQLPNAFLVMNILKDLLYAAAGGTLTPDLFYKLFRARNDLPRYQHDLLMEAEKRGKIKSAIRVCEYTLKKRNAGNIKRTLGKLQEQLAEMERKEAAE